MDERNRDFEEENKRLKLAYNKAVTCARSLAEELQEKNAQLLQLQEEMKIVNHKLNTMVQAETPDDSMLNYTLNYSIFGRAIQAALEENRLSGSEKLPFLQYITLERDILTGYISQITDIEGKALMRTWADLGLLERQSNGRYVFTSTKDGVSIRAVRLNKAAVELVREGRPL